MTEAGVAEEMVVPVAVAAATKETGVQYSSVTRGLPDLRALGWRMATDAEL